MERALALTRGSGSRAPVSMAGTNTSRYLGTIGPEGAEIRVFVKTTNYRYHKYLFPNDNENVYIVYLLSPLTMTDFRISDGILKVVNAIIAFDNRLIMKSNLWSVSA